MQKVSSQRSVLSSVARTAYLTQLKVQETIKSSISYS